MMDIINSAPTTYKRKYLTDISLKNELAYLKINSKIEKQSSGLILVLINVGTVRLHIYKQEVDK